MRCFRPLLVLGSLVFLASGTVQAEDHGAPVDRPNILWLTAEDHGPHLGCYGDAYATTPHLDALAARSLLYTRASSTAPVCAAARTTIITGMYAPSLGAQHMRSRVLAPEWLKLLPSLMAEAGYYCTNNSKEDYNLKIRDKGWHESSNKAHWKNRPEGKPFFAVFNTTKTHESQIRNTNTNAVHDPQKITLPPYHPDRPEVRKNWAQYYDRISQVDTMVQKHLDDLKKAGLEKDTIIFFYADHGSGMPRGKRYAGWSGVHVPMIVHIPQKYRHLAPSHYQKGGSSDRLVGFVDLAPTTLSLAGVKAPEWQQGHAFLGKYQAAKPRYSFGFRGRMDERPDVSRSVMDGRYIYIRNYLPYLPHGQKLVYQMQTPTTKVWRELYQQGKLNTVQSAFWRPHPAEELFDLQNDPHELVNLAIDPAYSEKLLELRQAHEKHLVDTKDLALMPEPLMHRLADRNELTPAALADQHYDPNTLLAYTELQLMKPQEAEQRFKKLSRKLSRQLSRKLNLKSERQAASELEVYWAKVYLKTLPVEQLRAHQEFISQVCPDDVLSCDLLASIAADDASRDAALIKLVNMVQLSDGSQADLFNALYASNALDAHQPLPEDVRKALAQRPETAEGLAGGYVMRMRQHLGLQTPKLKKKRKKLR